MPLKISFYKYQGTGNDFVMIDNQSGYFKYDTKLIRQLCDRKFGIGADGLIALENTSENDVDFKMVYFNADGRESSMCGNGGRCIVAFAKFLDLIDNHCTFQAIDGLHEAKIDSSLHIELKMKDVLNIETFEDSFVLDTGSPHFINIVDNVDEVDVKKEGARIRYSDQFKKEGINVNFIAFKNNKLHIRTYERGVEDETLSCGTGVTAAALASFNANLTSHKHIHVNTQGGNLQVKFEQFENGFKNIWLIGPANQVFKGEIIC
jgi:diaminopimelate epimerase